MNTGSTDTISVFDIYSIWYTPLLQRTWVLVSVIILAVIVVALVSAAVYYYLRRKKPLTDYELAMQRLQSLDPVWYVQKKKYRDYYAELTFVLKDYVIKTRHIPSGITDEELLESFKQEHADLAPVLERVVQGALYSKFARYEHSLSVLSQDLQLCQSLIDSLETQQKSQSALKNEQIK